MNFAKGVLETRLVTYKNLKNVLRPIPLNTPTKIELRPGHELRVTLLDANHCPGAVMFLIEGQGKAILYTGDIRSEPWWVNALSRHPCIMPYSSGIRRLDTIYLDTTFATKSDPYRDFPSKGDGLKELLAAVDKYPQDTVFHFNSWTFGYEEVWVALCVLLQTKMHLDSYKLRLFGSFTAPKEGNTIAEATTLCGFKLGNAWHDGCMTDDPTGRLHGCEPGHGCNVKHNPNTVRIVPLISRLPNGEEIPELGAGGGHGDIAQWHELDLSDQNAAMNLLSLCASIKDEAERKRAVDLVMDGIQSRTGKLSLPDTEMLDADDEITLQTLTKILANSQVSHAASDSGTKTDTSPTDSPKEIRFPYSRHSSYNELRHLVSAFSPRDLVPCTVHEPTWDPSLSMQSLFGDLCSSKVFVHDREMLLMYEARIAHERDQPDDDYDDPQTQSSVQPQSSQLYSTSQDVQQPNTEVRRERHPADQEAKQDSQPTQAVYQSAPESRCEGSSDLRSLSQEQSHSHSEPQLNRRRSRSPRKRKRSPDLPHPRTSRASSDLRAVTEPPSRRFAPEAPKVIQLSSDAEGETELAESDQALAPGLHSPSRGVQKESALVDEPSSQVSLSDGAFDSQHGGETEYVRRRKIERRKEAYRAAKRAGEDGGVEWQEYSTITKADELDLC